jgi:hypothetical protein
VLARSGVQAVVGQQQTLDGFAADDVRLDDFVEVSFGDVSVPDGIRIDHDIRTVLALIEATGLIGAHFALKAAFREFLLEQLLQLRLAAGIAASPRASRRALVAAHENVFFEFRHEYGVEFSRSTSRYSRVFQGC